jgi:hypothetical protein
LLRKIIPYKDNNSSLRKELLARKIKAGKKSILMKNPLKDTEILGLGRKKILYTQEKNPLYPGKMIP